MSFRDRYGNTHSTHSQSAFDHYQQALELLLAAQPGAIEALQQAVAADANYALASADLARTLQVAAQPRSARAAIDQAQRCLDDTTMQISDQERAHVGIVSELIQGKAQLAYQHIQQHVMEYPGDVLLVQAVCGVFGLIGFSGRCGREAENLAFMASLAKHYGSDWWFNSQYAFAHCEVGSLVQAEALNERAFAANPTNANAVHHRAHIHYETDESRAGLQALQQWRSSYAHDGILHCHLSWHAALWLLHDGDLDAAWTLAEAAIQPSIATAPPLNVMTDFVALLLRIKLANLPVPGHWWSKASAYARAKFPRSGLSFADMHTAIAVLLTDDSTATGTDSVNLLAELAAEPRGTAGDLVAFTTAAFMAFANEEWRGVVDSLTPVMWQHERLGGSRAQRDLLELVYIHALQRQGLNEDANRFALTRRPYLA